MIGTNANGTTTKNVASAGRPPVYQYYSSDGKAYDTYTAADNASKTYNQQQKEAIATSKYNTSLSNYQSSALTNGSTSSSTNSFLESWGSINNATLKTYTDMIAGLDSVGADSTITDLISEVKQQASDYSTLYGDLEQQAVASTSESMSNKNALERTMMEGAKADYAGVTGRAAADITGESETARAANERELMSLGVDPSSGQFGALTRKSFMDEARNKAIAMNTARTDEKTRSLEASTTAYGLIDPTESAGIASGIAANKTNYTTTQADLAQAENDRLMGIADAKTAIAGNMSDVASGYGSIGSTILGIDAATTGTTDSSGYGIELS